MDDMKWKAECTAVRLKDNFLGFVCDFGGEGRGGFGKKMEE
jgi:hypothetical protein